MNKNYPVLQIIFLIFSTVLRTRTLNRWERTDTVKPTNWTETELLGFNYFNTLNWLTTFPRLSLLRGESSFPTMRTLSPTLISWRMLGLSLLRDNEESRLTEESPQSRGELELCGNGIQGRWDYFMGWWFAYLTSYCIYLVLFLLNIVTSYFYGYVIHLKLLVSEWLIGFFRWFLLNVVAVSFNE